MFKITAGKGFQITFDNGCTLSVQFGPGNYCARRNAEFNEPKSAHHWESPTAECAILLPDGEFYPLPEGDGAVIGWQTVNDMCALIEVARNIKTEVPT